MTSTANEDKVRQSLRNEHIEDRVEEKRWVNERTDQADIIWLSFGHVGAY